VNITHDMRGEPLVTSSDEEHSELPVLRRSHDSKSLDYALRDHEPFLLESTLEAREIVEHLPCGPAHEEVCVHGLGGQVHDRDGPTMGYRYNHNQQSVGLTSAHRTPDGMRGHSGVQKYAGVFLGIR
jgi:hypothetical protein